ncbi:hypothetical protein [Pseudodesulfovibrio senegalensis]|uniref:Uncharacterized protein n=1 Tax=Pseudodesulfovibrio senegalensis TaxID=1721087 RepID=A0A6N6N623_9BACT|nr:hypothetical protein [Pseudodesulfovibrio senegalensis]KAB1442929.1 hypothetical protein F8A88_01245 [Pseudodesulfovibrio senegalensis]
MASANVQSVMNTLKENPDLLRDLNKALTMIFAASGVDLSVEEKKEFFNVLSENVYGEAGKEKVIVHVHVKS